MADQINDGGPAFPMTEHNHDGTHYHDYSGMTLRDYFATKALPAVIAVCNNDAREAGESHEAFFARCAYKLADAMLKARSA